MNRAHSAQLRTTTSRRSCHRSWSWLLTGLMILSLFGDMWVWEMPAEAMTPTFRSGRTFGRTDPMIGSMSIGDMDGNGTLDIVTVSRDRLVIYLNDGAGYFDTDPKGGCQDSATIRCAPLPREDIGQHVHMALGDIDGDGDLDIVVAAGDFDFETGETFSIGTILLNEHGYFTTARAFTTKTDIPTGMALGDLNANGSLDIVISYNDGQTIALLNNGTGNFPESRLIGDVGSETGAVWLADMNGNGRLDVITANIYDDHVIYFNDGNGSFPTSAVFGEGMDSVEDMAIGDMNRDGMLDVVIANRQQHRVYVNDGSGRLNTSYVFGDERSQVAQRSLVLGDLNGDGNLDIVMGNPGQPDQVFFGNEAGRLGSFDIQQRIGGADSGTTAVALADLNGDGALDIVTAASLGVSEIYLSDATGALSSPSANVRHFSSADIRAITNGDIDNDGDEDIIAATFREEPIAYLQDRDDFRQRRTFGEELSATAVATGDLNGDGFLDVVIGNMLQTDVDEQGNSSLETGTGQNMIYFNDGSGNFSEEMTLGTRDDGTTAVAIADVNGDGFLDIITFNRQVLLDTTPVPNTGQTILYLNDGSGNFPTNVVIGGGIASVQSGVVGDVNGDGFPDVVVSSADGRGFVFINDGAGNFPITTPFTPVDWYDPFAKLALGDVNGDGHLDIVGVGNTNAVFMNDGTGMFAEAPALFGEPFGSVTALALADVNDDGHLDIVTGAYGRQNVIFLNDGNGAFSSGQSYCSQSAIVCFGIGNDITNDVLVSDVNDDGFLDIIVANSFGESSVYFSTPEHTFPKSGKSIQPLGQDNEETQQIELADVNGDGWLDILTSGFSSVADTETMIVHLNDQHGRFLPTESFGDGEMFAVGDMNGDGHLDIVATNEVNDSEDMFEHAIYLNDGNGKFSRAGIIGASNTDADAIAIADLDNDGVLDVVITFHTPPDDEETDVPAEVSMIYLNDGNGTFSSHPMSDEEQGLVSSIALGDIDQDGDTDIIVGVSPGQNWAYLNDGTGMFPERVPFGTGEDFTRAVALADVDGDGDLDIIVGNLIEQSIIYLNDGNGNVASGFVRCEETAIVRCLGSGTDTISSIAVTDIDGDGDLDIVAGSSNIVFINNGIGTFNSQRVFSPSDRFTTNDVAAGDLDGDGDPDLVFGNSGTNIITWNNQAGRRYLPNTPPMVSVSVPEGALPATGFANPHIFTDQIIQIPYTLTDNENDAVGFIRVFYSPDGGGKWYPAMTSANTNEVRTGLTLNRELIYPWDTFASGFFGQSDNVVLRIEAYPSASTAPNRLAVAPLHPMGSAMTTPFRVRGTQVQVFHGSEPAADAIVYRLPAGSTSGATPLCPTGRDATMSNAFRTTPLGFLEGRGIVGKGDRLIALLPVQSMGTYTVYLTNANPTPTGVDTHIVTTPGIQRLTVSDDYPLILFDLQVTLEWDARKDSAFQERLRADLWRTSESLYDSTNGQVALGRVQVYQALDYWEDANIRIFATNRLRPNADQGGVIRANPDTEEINRIVDPNNPQQAYESGQVRIGATWNRYGDSTSGNLSEDWPRTLAHELGHYALFLDDNYLGLENGMITSVEGCPGAMSDPYRDDYTEFHPKTGWHENENCLRTLSHQATGRSDWETMTTFYPYLRDPMVPFADLNPGPTTLPLNVTEIEMIAPDTDDSALIDVPSFALVDANGARIETSSSTRAFLFDRHGDYLMDLGGPVRDRIETRGASVGDQLCVYDVNASRLGCEQISRGDEQLVLTTQEQWKPDVIITPVTSRTLGVTVTGLLPDDLPTLMTRLYPENYPDPDDNRPDETIKPIYEIELTRVGNEYAGTIEVIEPALAGKVFVWVPPTTGTVLVLSAVADYGLGGNPGVRRRTRSHRVNEHGRRRRAAGQRRRTRGIRRSRNAPSVSPDGQVILFGDNLQFNEGEFYSLQVATSTPDAPQWATKVGSAYRLLGSANAPDLTGASISIGYLSSDVPAGEEDGIWIYFWDGTQWVRLETSLNSTENVASAAVVGTGLYTLMSTTRLSLFGPGWNNVAYPIRTQRAIADALASIQGDYRSVWSFDETLNNQPNTPPWKAWSGYHPDAPTWVNTLHTLEFGRSYWIYVSRDVDLFLKGISIDPAPSTSTVNTSFITRLRRTLAARSIPTPARYYGAVDGQSAFTPTTNMTVTATINGQTCGQDFTQRRDGSIVYAATVVAADCGGRVGDIVRFSVNDQPMAPTPAWQNIQANHVPLIPAPTLSLTSTNIVANESDGSVQIGVTLNQASPYPVRVSYQTYDMSTISGQDYISATGTLTMPAGTTSQTITLTLMDDELPEGTKVFAIELHDPINAALAPENRAWITVYDDDTTSPPTLPIVQFVQPIMTVQEHDGVAQVEVALSTPSDLPITVRYATKDGTAVAAEDYIGTSGTLGFAPGELTQTITVPIIDDAIAEPNEMFTIELSNPTNAHLGDTTITTITIQDNDQGPAATHRIYLPIVRR